MTSVQNHRRPLNGSKLFLFFISFLFICACTTQKKAVDKSSGKAGEQDKAVEMVEQYDPESGQIVLVPRDQIVVDTIVWTKDDTPPIITDEDLTSPIPTPDNPARITLLMPFNAAKANLFSEQQDPRLNRYLHYYAGMQMAMEEVKAQALPVEVEAVDAEAINNSFTILSGKPIIQDADVIVGPYRKKDIEAYASYGNANEKMVLSPWRPAFKTEEANPFFLQLSPGLDAHVEAITAYIHTTYPEEDVYVVGRDTDNEQQRVEMFATSELHTFQQLIVTDTTPDLLETDVHALMDTLETTIFVLPYYSRSDEAFVNEFLRKLHAESNIRDIVVFGLPQWVGFSNLNPNYMESLHLHLSISSFVDTEHPQHSEFRRKFFNTYHVVPDMNAYMGYDFMVWMSQSVATAGQEGLIRQIEPPSYGMASGFDLQPVYSDEPGPETEMQVPLYYENRMIRMLRYEEQDFKLIKELR